MKNIKNIMLLSFGFFLTTVSADNVTLTKDDVESASDIETAINDATHDGRENGTVVLDGKKGEFIFTGEDKVLDIIKPKITLQGIHRAILKNHEGIIIGVSGVVIKGLTMTGFGIMASGDPKDVVIENNNISSSQRALEISGKNWNIRGNTIFGGWGAIKTSVMTNSVIEKNVLDTPWRYETTGIDIEEGSTGIKVLNNFITSNVNISISSGKNQVIGNYIAVCTEHGGSKSGIIVFTGGNLIKDNRIFCPRNRLNPSALIQVLPETLTNTIHGNRIWIDGMESLIQ